MNNNMIIDWFKDYFNIETSIDETKISATDSIYSRKEDYLDYIYEYICKFDKLHMYDCMCVFYDGEVQIPKKSGGYREISIPNKELKYIQKKIANKFLTIRNDLIKNRKDHYSYGFEYGKGVYDNAKVHVNSNIVINIDIEDFFGSINFMRVYKFLEKNKYYGVDENNKYYYKRVKIDKDMNMDFSEAIKDDQLSKISKSIIFLLSNLICYKNKLPQGAPTSPVVANMIMDNVDYKINKICKKYGLIYTRYADDMTFSTNDWKFLEKYDIFLIEIENLLNNNYFKINKKKTRLQTKYQNQEVTGLTVNKRVNVQKKYYKIVRSQVHSYLSKGYFFDKNEKKENIDILIGKLSFINYIEKLNNDYKVENPQYFMGEKYYYRYHNKECYSMYNSFNHRKSRINDKMSCRRYNEKERLHRLLLCLKYFYANDNDVFFICEGKTDFLYFKSALSMNKENKLKISCFNDLGEFTKYYFSSDVNDYGGAEKLFSDIYSLYVDKEYKIGDEKVNFIRYIYKKSKFIIKNPVIMVVDNELSCSGKPIRKIMNEVYRKNNTKKSKAESDLKNKGWVHIVDNFYLATYKYNQNELDEFMKYKLQIQENVDNELDSADYNEYDYEIEDVVLSDNYKNMEKKLIKKCQTANGDYEFRDIKLSKNLLSQEIYKNRRLYKFDLLNDFFDKVISDIIDDFNDKYKNKNVDC